MRMKPSIAVMAAASLLSLSTLAFAQQGGGAPPAGGGQNQQGPPQGEGRRGGGGGFDPAAQVERLTKELDLTADQQTKVKDILTKQGADMKALRDQGLSREDAQPKMHEIREATTKAINAVLTADQQKKYADIQERNRQGGGGPRGPGL